MAKLVVVRPSEHGSLASLKLLQFVRRKKMFINLFDGAKRPPACHLSSSRTPDSTESFCRSRDCISLASEAERH